MESVFKQMLSQAKMLSGQRKLKEAQIIYENWLQKQPVETPLSELDPQIKSDIALVYNNVGQLKYLHVDFEGAAEDYDKAIAFDPELASAYFNRGTISYRMGYFDKALDDMVKANELSPENVEFQLGLERTKVQFHVERSNANVNADKNDSKN